MNDTIFYTIITVILLLLNISGCSTLHNIIYQPNINQGNYFTKNDLTKINIGMQKELIFSLLGTPILHDPFGSNTYYYIFFNKSHHKKNTQKILTLIFDNNDILISMHYK